MVNFGYPYNDKVICKDSTDYLGARRGGGGQEGALAPPWKFKNIGAPTTVLELGGFVSQFATHFYRVANHFMKAWIALSFIYC